ncbi:MAG: hypothetical protein JWL66_1334 [Sphingomonadales bacterium]|nr:hypothetical protein [Sphingomonadales bacterium]
MSHFSQARQLARVRDVERRMAAATVARASIKLREASDRLTRLDALSQMIAADLGPLSGRALASGGECVARLLAGAVAISGQNDRLVAEVEVARRTFGLADTRAQIAGRNFVGSERAEARASDLREALKLPGRSVS